MVEESSWTWRKLSGFSPEHPVVAIADMMSSQPVTAILLAPDEGAQPPWKSPLGKVGLVFLGVSIFLGLICTLIMPYMIDIIDPSDNPDYMLPVLLFAALVLQNITAMFAWRSPVALDISFLLAVSLSGAIAVWIAAKPTTGILLGLPLAAWCIGHGCMVYQSPKRLVTVVGSEKSGYRLACFNCIPIGCALLSAFPWAIMSTVAYFNPVPPLLIVLINGTMMASSRAGTGGGPALAVSAILPLWWCRLFWTRFDVWPELSSLIFSTCPVIGGALCTALVFYYLQENVETDKQVTDTNHKTRTTLKVALTLTISLGTVLAGVSVFVFGVAMGSNNDFWNVFIISFELLPLWALLITLGCLAVWGMSEVLSGMMFVMLSVLTAGTCEIWAPMCFSMLVLTVLWSVFDIPFQAVKQRTLVVEPQHFLGTFADKMMWKVVIIVSIVACSVWGLLMGAYVINSAELLKSVAIENSKVPNQYDILSVYGMMETGWGTALVVGVFRVAFNSSYYSLDVVAAVLATVIGMSSGWGTDGFYQNHYMPLSPNGCTALVAPVIAFVAVYSVVSIKYVTYENAGRFHAYAPVGSEKNTNSIGPNQIYAEMDERYPEAVKPRQIH